MQEFVPDSDLVESNDESLHSSRSHTWSPIAETNSYRSFPWNTQIIPPKCRVLPRWCTSFQMPPFICKNAGICKKITVLFLMCEMQGYASKSQCPSWCAKCRDTHNVFRLQTQCSPRCAKRSEVLCSLSIAVMFSLYENGSVVYAITVFFTCKSQFL